MNPNILELNFDKATEPESEKKEIMKEYPYEEVFDHTLAYFKGDQLAANVWINKYALKNSDNQLFEKDPNDMHRRMAGEIFRIEQKYPNHMSEDEIFSLLADFKYIVPQGGPMTGIGNNFQVASLSNCFVIGNDRFVDSYGSILKTDEEQVQLMKRRGGVGHDLGNVRPYGRSVQNSAITSTGVVSFMERYSNSTREVAQDGRRGALMLTLPIQHPDACAFIDAKTDHTKITGANISIKVDDAFMESVINDSHYTQQFPLNQKNPSLVKKVKAREIWDKIIQNAWKSAEPGLLFWDTILRESVPDCYADHGFKTLSTNPCGEIPLCPYDSCRLLAINLVNYVKSPFEKEATFDLDLFKEHAGKALRIMDDIIDLELEKIDSILQKLKKDPEPGTIKRNEIELWEKIRTKCVDGRRAGIGITAEGDMLAALGLTYGTEKANKKAVEVHKTLALEVYRSSVNLAKERGSFPVFDHKKEVDNPFIKRIREADPDLYNEMGYHGRRNIAMLTIAPTGTTSLMTQTTSGIEPVFKINYKRRRKINPQEENVIVSFVDKSGDAWEEYNVFHHHFITWAKTNGLSEEELKFMKEDDLRKVIGKSPYLNSTAEDIDWVAKVHMQGAVQKWVDHSISATVNVPESTTPEKVSEIYMEAWKNGCKGITIYREGSRDGVLVSTKEKDKGSFHKRPKVLEAELVRFNNHDEKWIAMIGMKDGHPYEIFTGKAEDSFLLPSYVEKGWVIKNRIPNQISRYDFEYEDSEGFKVTIQGLSRAFDKEYWNYAKLVSGLMRHGMPIQFIVNMVEALHLNDDSLNTWKKGVIRALSKYIPDGTQPKQNVCPECKEQALYYQEGCLTCQNCGHTKCG